MNILEKSRLNQTNFCNLFVIDNFYENPMEVRKLAIEQIEQIECYKNSDNFPGKRSKPLATEKHKEIFNKILEPFFGKVINFLILNDRERFCLSNGCFHCYTTNDIKGWVHVDDLFPNGTSWAAVIYLTPDAPIKCGTKFLRYKDGNIIQSDEKVLNNSENILNDNHDYTKWEVVSTIGNVFNRLILYQSNQYHTCMDYFGKDINDGRLIQIFFFNTER